MKVGELTLRGLRIAAGQVPREHNHGGESQALSLSRAIYGGEDWSLHAKGVQFCCSAQFMGPFHLYLDQLNDSVFSKVDLVD